MFPQELNAPDSEARLTALKKIAASETFIDMSEEVNNHVHTLYSFSPYSPTAAAYMARKAGLRAVGIMDHDSVSGVKEMNRACNIIGIASTAGCEVRVNMNGTAVEGRKTNNPDSQNISYIAIHGIAERHLPATDAFLKPIREQRNIRNRRETENLSALFQKAGLGIIDFDKDVLPLSKAIEGGGVTERHILFAAAGRLGEEIGFGPKVRDFLVEKFGITIAPSFAKKLAESDRKAAVYALLGLMKAEFLPRIFVQPDYNECISVYEAVEFANSIDAISCYAYLGDVGESPTGDKKAEAFEDSYLDMLIPELKNIGFRGVTYMPPRNTKAQLKRLAKLCGDNNLMEISGVDINSLSQSFNCPELLDPDFSHLIDSAWALIAHERIVEAGEKGLFADGFSQNALKIFAEKGKALYY